MTKQPQRKTQKKQYTVFKDQVEDINYLSCNQTFKQCKPVSEDDLVRVALDEYIDKLKHQGL